MKHSPAARAAIVAALVLACSAALAVDADFDMDRGFRVRSEDRDFRMTLGGRVHLDSAWYDDDITPLEDDVIWRRVRPRVDLEYGDNWRLRVDYDFGDVSDGLKNAWVQYDFAKRWDVRVGSQVVPFGIEETMSSNDLMFMERPLATMLAPGMLTGALVRGHSKNMSYSFGAFGNGVEDEDRRKIDGRSLTTRLTAAPVRKRRQVVHVGISAEYRKADSNEDARFRSRPESDATDRRLVDTRTLEGIDDLVSIGTEVAWAWRSTLLQGEYLLSRVGRETESTVDLGGWYVAASYLPTGERRPYIRHIGSFGEIDPRHAWGAIELRLRYGELDLEDGDVTGGEEANLGAGINWYWNRNCRLMLEYLDIDADPNRDGDAESPTLWQARLQVGF